MENQSKTSVEQICNQTSFYMLPNDLHSPYIYTTCHLTYKSHGAILHFIETVRFTQFLFLPEGLLGVVLCFPSSSVNAIISTATVSVLSWEIYVVFCFFLILTWVLKSPRLTEHSFAYVRKIFLYFSLSCFFRNHNTI